MSDSKSKLRLILENGKQPAATGLMALIPVMVTLVIVNWLLHLAAAIPGTNVLEITPFFYANQAIKLAVLSVAGGFFIMSLGNFLETRRGFKAEKIVDRIFDQIPVVGSIYNAAKVTAETVLGGSEDLGQPVKIDLGRIEVTGFKTGNRTPEGKSLVFIPTSPNITSGFVVELEEEWLEKTDETVSDAITKVLSAGFGAETQPGAPMTDRKTL